MSSSLVIDNSDNDPITELLLRRSGAVALISKATEGSGYQDPTFQHHREVAHWAGVPFGSFLFLHEASAGDEAGYYLAYASPRAGDIAPIIDCEVTDGAPMSSVAARCQSCALALETAGYTMQAAPILYSSASFLLQLYAEQPTLKRLRVWEAQYPRPVLSSWSATYLRLRYRLANGVTVAMWQFTDGLTVGSRRFDASTLLVPLKSLLIPPGRYGPA